MGELQDASEPVHVQQDVGYLNFGIYSFGRGLFAKPPISGMQTSAGTLYRVRAGIRQANTALIPATLERVFATTEAAHA